MKRIALTVGGVVVGAGSVLAQGTYTAPIDMATAGTDVAGMIAPAALAGLAIFVGLFAIYVIKSAFIKTAA